MTRKDLIESIRQNIPEGLTQLEIARYVYIELGKQRRFDHRYYYGNKETEKKIYALSQESRIHPEKFYNKRTLICVSLSNIYHSILKEFGIESRVISDDILLDGHVMPVLEIDDEKRGKMRIKADLQRDLEYIQTGMETACFGTSDEFEQEFDKIDEEELKEIDKKIGYIKDEYRDVEINEIKKEIKGKNAHESLRAILQDDRVYSDTNFHGIVERRKYYNYLLKSLLNQFINKKIFMFTCYRETLDANGEKQRDYTLCAYSYENRQIIPYLYSNKEERFVPVTIEKLVELEQDGLIFGTMQRTKGLYTLKRAMEIEKDSKKQNQTNINEETSQR